MSKKHPLPRVFEYTVDHDGNTWREAIDLNRVVSLVDRPDKGTVQVTLDAGSQTLQFDVSVPFETLRDAWAGPKPKAVWVIGAGGRPTWMHHDRCPTSEGE